MFVFCGILAPTYPLRRHEYVSSLYLHTPRLIWPPKNIQTIYSILRPRENQKFLHLRSEALSMIKLGSFYTHGGHFGENASFNQSISQR